MTSFADAVGGNTLRAAIMQANAGGDDYVINLPAGTYTLSIAGRAETANFTGDLDIHTPGHTVQIVGADETNTVIDAAQIDRAFHVLGGNVTFRNVTIQNGKATDDGVHANSTDAGVPPVSDALGGGVLIDASAAVTFQNVILQHNTALGANGANGDDQPDTAIFPFAGTPGRGARGAGIYDAGGALTLTNVQLNTNTAQGGMGGQGSNGLKPAAAPVHNGGDGGPGGDAQGGGLYLAGGTFQFTQMTATGNTATAGAGGAGGAAASAPTQHIYGVGGKGGAGGVGQGGGVFFGGGSLSDSLLTLNSNGAGGGNGGNGGDGSSAVSGTDRPGRGGDAGAGGAGAGGGLYLAGGTAGVYPAVQGNGAGGGVGGQGGANDGNGGAGGAAYGGGFFVAGGSLMADIGHDEQLNGAPAGSSSVGLSGNVHGGSGGPGGLGSPWLSDPGAGGLGGKGGDAQGGGIYVGGGATVFQQYINGSATGGAGGTGGGGMGAQGGQPLITVAAPVAARGGDGGTAQGGGLYVGGGSFTHYIRWQTGNSAAIGGAGGQGGIAAPPVGTRENTGGPGGNGGNAQGGGIFYANGLLTTDDLPIQSYVQAGSGGTGGLSDPPNGIGSPNGTPGAAGSISGIDDNLSGLARITGTVFNDVNQDGLFEPADEPTVPSDTVMLFDAGHNLLGETSTSGGSYQIRTSYTGQASLQFSQPAGLQFTHPNQGSDPLVNSAADPTTGKTAPFAVQAGTTATRNAGLLNPITVSIAPVTPSPFGTVEAVVTFSAPVSGVDNGAFTLTRNGQPVTPTYFAIAPLNPTGSPPSSAQYTLDLSTYSTQAGSYTFSVSGKTQVSGSIVSSIHDAHSNEVYASAQTSWVTRATIGSVSPGSGSFTGGTPVTIMGIGFTDAQEAPLVSAVKFGGIPASFFVLSSTAIAATVPAGVSPGPVDVTVTTPGGTVTAAGAFTYAAPTLHTPTVTNASTTAGAQTTSGLILTSSYLDVALDGGALVRFFQITNITGGSLFQNDGVTPISNGQFITAAQGAAGLKFTPAAGLPGSSPMFFNVQASVTAATAGLGGGIATASITPLASFTAGPFGFALGLDGPGAGAGGDAVATDAAGNVYVTGIFSGTVDFDPGPGVTNLTGQKFGDVFVAKYTVAGALAWARQFTGELSATRAGGIAVDGAGNVLVTGRFTGTMGFDPGVSAHSLTNQSVGTPFIAKLDSGGHYVWAKQFAASDSNSGGDSSAVAVDGAGDVYATGTFFGTLNFDPGPGTHNLTSTGGSGPNSTSAANLYVAKLDSGGNFVWADQFSTVGSGSGGQPNALAVDGAGNVLTTGYFFGTVNFNPAGTANLTEAGTGSDIFVSKLDSAGHFVWARQFAESGTNFGHGQGITLDGSGNVYTTGSFQGTADFDPGPGTANLVTADRPATVTGPEKSAIFVSKLDSAGNYVWAKQFAGGGGDVGSGVAVNAPGDVYAAGYFTGTAAFGSASFTAAGHGDAFVERLDSAGNLVWVRRFTNSGGTNDGDWAAAPAVTNTGDVYTTGSFSGTVNFDPGTGTHTLHNVGSSAAFVAQLLDVPSAPVITAPAAAGTGANTPLTFAAGNAISLADAGANPLTVSLSVGHGTLTLAGTRGLTFSTGTGRGDTAMTFRGALAGLNAGLNGLTYAPAANYSGSDTLTVRASDGVTPQTATVALTVKAIAQGPTLSGAVAVNPAWAGLAAGTHPAGSPAGTVIGVNAFASLQAAVAATLPGGTVTLAAGIYSESLTLTRSIILHGSGSGTTTLAGHGPGVGLSVTGPGVVISGLTVRGFGAPLVAGGGTVYLALSDVHFTGNTFGAVLNGVATVVITGGGGNKTFFVRPGALAQAGDNPVSFSGVQNLTVDGGGGNNRLVVYLNDANAASTVWLTSAAIARDKGSFLLWYRSVGGSFGGGVAVVLGDGPETVVVQGQLAGAPTTVYGEGGDDTFYVAVMASSGYRNLLLDGGPGNDRLAVFDRSGGAALKDVVTVRGEGTVQVSYPGGIVEEIQYQNLEQLLGGL